ncbi:hypothetical protein KZZ52_09025 [Dactylosporangium sp. AC04546]|uniref:hypothetical protein n=1 Tax=Dactylosporangium sp. AC04546 TaxID=2862460 RepID=UPI001EDC963C|nr:hypothetical protein [Dactylosporangium sp. AC04546]WVK85509.1 hypothetical protein KZZ52_09025 [Dactylosporangium sp. AC04546]
MTYAYVGPPELRSRPAPTGVPVASPADFAAWLAAQTAADLAEPFTFVVMPDGALRLAPRRSEHVACAGGSDVLSAGEIAFTGGAVREVTNQSTGYCPAASSWPAVAAALSRAGLSYPPGFTSALTYRHCPACAALNVVRDEDYTCAVCGSALPL